MDKRYAIHPNYVYSKNDGQRHYVGAKELIRLYGVDSRECVIIDKERPETFLGLNTDNLINLRPRHDGNYSIPTDIKDTEQ